MSSSLSLPSSSSQQQSQHNHQRRPPLRLARVLTAQVSEQTTMTSSLRHSLTHLYAILAVSDPLRQRHLNGFRQLYHVRQLYPVRQLNVCHFYDPLSIPYGYNPSLH